MQVNRAVQAVLATGGSWPRDRSGMGRQVRRLSRGLLYGICNEMSKDIFNGSFIVGGYYCEMSGTAKISVMLIWLAAKEMDMR